MLFVAGGGSRSRVSTA